MSYPLAGTILQSTHSPTITMASAVASSATPAVQPSTGGTGTLKLTIEFGCVVREQSSRLFADPALPSMFRGGLELLFHSQPRHTVELPAEVATGKTDVKYLISWMKENLLSDRERSDMFGDGDGV